MLSRSLGRFTFVAVALGCAPSVAQSALPAQWNTRILLEPKSIDLAIPPNGSKKTQAALRNLSRAEEQFRAENWLAVQKLARTVVKDKNYADVASILLARSMLKHSEHLLSLKRWQEAENQAQHCIETWFRTAQRHPEAPSLKLMPEEVGRSEVFIGYARSARGLHLAALEFFSRGFQRLLSNGKLGIVGVDEIRAFGTSCKKAESIGCRSWVQRLLNLSSKESREFATLKELFPEQAAQQRPSWTGSKLTQNYKSPDADQAAFDAAFDTYLNGKASNAAREFQKFLDEFPRSQHRHRARFWLGQTFSLQNEHDRATRAYEQIIREAPLSYHGLLASFMTGITPETAISATLPNVVEFDPNLQPADLLHFDRAMALLSAGAKDLAAAELREFRVRENLSSSFLFYLAWTAHEAGAHLATFGTLTELINRGADGVYTSRVLPWVFPVAHYELVQKHAKATSLDPILVLSLIKQESAFEAGIGSGAGAQGLMQLMPATAVETDPQVQRSKLHDPDTNIRVGTLYLKKMLGRFKGNIALALAAYNAGPYAVDRWVRENRAKRGLLEFIEQIPYRETRDYVGSIIRNYYWYSKQLGQEPLRDLDRFFVQVERPSEPESKATPLPVEPTPEIPTPITPPDSIGPIEPTPQPQASPGPGV